MIDSGMGAGRRSPSRRDQKKEQTRVDLIRAAVELFRERGYENTSVEDIVERAGYSRSTFFRYFGLKEDVVFGNIPDRIAGLQARLAAADPNRDPLEVAREEVTHEIINISALAPELEAECAALWFAEPALRHHYFEFALQVEEALTVFFGKVWGVDPEVTPECRVVAIAMVGVGRAARGGPRSDMGASAILDSLNRGFKVLTAGLRSAGQRPAT